MRVVLLGKLVDLAGAAELGIAGPLDWQELLAELPEALANEVKGEKVKLALDGQVLANKTSLQAEDGAEIALLPPVSGG